MLKALLRLELCRGRVERRPQCDAAAREHPDTAVTARKRPAHGLLEERAQVLVHVSVPPGDVRRTAGTGVVAPSVEQGQPVDERPEHGSHDRVRKPWPGGVQDSCPGMVDLPVELPVDLACSATRHASTSVTAASARALGAVPVRSTALIDGETSVTRRSCVAAAFVAPVTPTSVCFRVLASAGRRSSTRCTEP